MSEAMDTYSEVIIPGARYSEGVVWGICLRGPKVNVGLSLIASKQG